MDPIGAFMPVDSRVYYVQREHSADLRVVHNVYVLELRRNEGHPVLIASFAELEHAHAYRDERERAHDR